MIFLKKKTTSVNFAEHLVCRTFAVQNVNERTLLIIQIEAMTSNFTVKNGFFFEGQTRFVVSNYSAINLVTVYGFSMKTEIRPNDVGVWKIKTNKNKIY